MIQHHPHGALADLGRELVRRLARHGSILLGSWSLRQTRGGSHRNLNITGVLNALPVSSSICTVFVDPTFAKSKCR